MANKIKLQPIPCIAEPAILNDEPVSWGDPIVVYVKRRLYSNDTEVNTGWMVIHDLDFTPMVNTTSNSLDNLDKGWSLNMQCLLNILHNHGAALLLGVLEDKGSVLLNVCPVRAPVYSERFYTLLVCRSTNPNPNAHIAFPWTAHPRKIVFSKKATQKFLEHTLPSDVEYQGDNFVVTLPFFDRAHVTVEVVDARLTLTVKKYQGASEEVTEFKPIRR